MRQVKHTIKAFIIITLIVALTIMMTSCAIYFPKKEFTFKETLLIIRSNTGRFVPYMGSKQKQILRLCNIARKNRPLLLRYIELKYGDEVLSKFKNQNYRLKSTDYTLLRPSFFLTLGATYHAVHSGFSGYKGHRWMRERLLLSFNFNLLIPGVYGGENCYYGEKKASDVFIGWVDSSGHRKNILSPEYLRCGSSRFIHNSRYRTNTVQCFSGPKLIDIIIRPNKLKIEK